jgi:hypothetical protein
VDLAGDEECLGVWCEGLEYLDTFSLGIWSEEARQPVHIGKEPGILGKEGATAHLEQGWQRQAKRTSRAGLIQENVVRV